MCILTCFTSLTPQTFDTIWTHRQSKETKILCTLNQALKVESGTLRFFWLFQSLVLSLPSLCLSLRPPTMLSITLLSSCGLPICVTLFLCGWGQKYPNPLLLLSPFPCSLSLTLSSNSPTKAQDGLCAWCRCPGPWKGPGWERGPFTQTPTCSRSLTQMSHSHEFINAFWLSAGFIDDACEGGMRSFSWRDDLVGLLLEKSGPS